MKVIFAVLLLATACGRGDAPLPNGVEDGPCYGGDADLGQAGGGGAPGGAGGLQGGCDSYVSAAGLAATAASYGVWVWARPRQATAARRGTRCSAMLAGVASRTTPAPKVTMAAPF